jgi:hypothetical protein
MGTVWEVAVAKLKERETPLKKFVTIGF